MRPRFETSPGIGTGGDTPQAPLALTSDEIQSLIKAAIAEGAAGMMAEAARMVRALERRVEELERRPVAVAVPPTPTPSPLAPPPPRTDVMSSAPALHAPPVVSYAPVPVSIGPIPVSRAPAPLAPVLDVAQIEREVHIPVDSALDGSRRRRRLMVVVVLLFLVSFGALFAMLAQSYAPS
jgi:hypothetical protein